MGKYEVILKGFDGGTDSTDHLIKWIEAYCEVAVKHYCAEKGLEIEKLSNCLPNDYPCDDVAPWYLNFYRCDCGEEWQDEWSCTCDDKCPNCNTSVQAFDFVDLLKT